MATTSLFPEQSGGPARWPCRGGGSDHRSSRPVEAPGSTTLEAMTTYVWTDGTFCPVDEPLGPIRVADSWRQSDGRIRRLDLHRERFAREVGKLGVHRDGAAMVDAAVRLVPDAGDWFPRVRLVGDALYLDLRRGPERRRTASVRVLGKGDPRSHPRVKGPDLAAGTDLIRAANADEVLIRDRSGVVLEAAHSAVVWWDDDVLCVPTLGLAVLRSVTRQIVEEHARDRDIEVCGVTAQLSELDGREAWLLNAYQGLRLVTSWEGVDISAGGGVRFPTWRDAVENSATS